MLEKLYRWGTAWAYPSATISAEEAQRYVEVDDRGAEVTVFAFTGLAAQYAGLPTFEFHRLLKECGDFNLVFLRDMRRLSYHVSPAGTIDGLAFYERQVKELMASLGARYHVAVGASVGGSAALYYAARCGMDQAIAFAPGFPLSVYCSPLQQLLTYCDLWRLVRSPAAYRELVVVTVGAWICEMGLRHQIGPAHIWPVIETYRQCVRRPRATVYYGAGCKPDVRQAKLFDGLPEVRRVELPTLMHNCAMYLKERGELSSTIRGEIETGLRAVENLSPFA